MLVYNTNKKKNTFFLKTDVSSKIFLSEKKSKENSKVWPIFYLEKGITSRNGGMEKGREWGRGERDGRSHWILYKPKSITWNSKFFKGKRMISIPLSCFKAQKFTIACNSHLLFFFAPILILDLFNWFCASDHGEEF